jgi:hypothetical protein
VHFNISTSSCLRGRDPLGPAGRGRRCWRRRPRPGAGPGANARRGPATTAGTGRRGARERPSGMVRSWGAWQKSGAEIKERNHRFQRL